MENASIEDAYKLAVQSISNAASVDLLDLCQEVCSDYGDLANCARALQIALTKDNASPLAATRYLDLF